MDSVEFGADGIREFVGKSPFLPPLTVRIGQALGQFVADRSENPVVVMGRDTRPSGLTLSICLAAGIMGQGVDVINLGIIPTPGVAYATRRQEADLGIIITASHSPLEMNGIKLLRSSGLRLQREEEIDIENIISQALHKSFEYPKKIGHETDGDHLFHFYLQSHLDGRPKDFLEGVHIVLDCSDGAASRIAPDVLKKLGADVSVIRNGIEGQHINFECVSEHARAHPEFLASQVREHKASYGFALDGDGDRLIVVDANANVFDGYDLTYLLANHFHSRGTLPQDTVVTTHQSNRGLGFALEAIGISTVYTNNGDRHLEAALWTNDYLLAGESGGNVIVNDGAHTASDAIFTSILLGEVLTEDLHIPLIERVKPLREMMDEHPQIVRSFHVSGGITAERRNVIQKFIDEKEKTLGEGSRIKCWNSSTEPGIIRVMAEGCRRDMREEVAHVVDDIHNFISSLVHPTY